MKKHITIIVFVRTLLSFCILPELLAVTAMAASTPGSGASTPLIQQSFVNAYNRGTFASLVGNPLNDVHALGSPGRVQDSPRRGVALIKFALTNPDPAVPPSALDTLQVYGDLYGYYTSGGQGTAGYPVIDTTACPTNT